MASACLCVTYVQSMTTGLLALAPQEAPNYSLLVLEKKYYFLTGKKPKRKEGQNLHLGLSHDLHKVVLTLSNLNYLLNQACANLVLKFRDAISKKSQLSILVLSLAGQNSLVQKRTLQQYTEAPAQTAHR